MPRIRLVHVFDRLAQERLGEAYGLLVGERNLVYKRNTQ